MTATVTFGERRHELCRFGRLTEAYIIEGSKETATSAPLCTFDPPGPVPPALTRVWGGIIDVERDCAVCWCFAEVPVDGSPEPAQTPSVRRAS